MHYGTVVAHDLTLEYISTKRQQERKMSGTIGNLFRFIIVGSCSVAVRYVTFIRFDCVCVFCFVLFCFVLFSKSSSSHLIRFLFESISNSNFNSIAYCTIVQSLYYDNCTSTKHSPTYFHVVIFYTFFSVPFFHFGLVYFTVYITVGISIN